LTQSIFAQRKIKINKESSIGSGDIWKNTPGQHLSGVDVITMIIVIVVRMMIPTVKTTNGKITGGSEA
jgi:hypothetical protein